MQAAIRNIGLDFRKVTVTVLALVAAVLAAAVISYLAAGQGTHNAAPAASSQTQAGPPEASQSQPVEETGHHRMGGALP